MPTGSVIGGRADVGAIVCTPPPPMLKSIVSWPALALLSRIACRSDPEPSFAPVVTVKAEGRVRSPRDSTRSRMAFGRDCLMRAERGEMGLRADRSIGAFLQVRSEERGQGNTRRTNVI